MTITNVGTGVSIVSSTNSDGIYDAPSVPTGSYTITFAKTGFKNFVREGVTLEIQTIAVDATLQVGNASEQVVVSAETPLVETETTDQHLDLSTQAIEAAPIVGTDWRAEMIQLIPGVNNGGGTGTASGQGIGVNGTQPYNVNFLIDGSYATAPRDFNGSNYYMPIDAIEEVSVNSSNANAQYGNGLTSVNVITKSGTNQWHGSAYEYVQNTALNARGFYNATGPKVRGALEYIRRQRGRAGPKEQAVFLFQSTSATLRLAPTSGLYTYPTAAMEAGDFYGITGATGPAFNPTTGMLLAPMIPWRRSFRPTSPRQPPRDGLRDAPVR